MEIQDKAIKNVEALDKLLKVRLCGEVYKLKRFCGLGMVESRITYT